MSVERANVVLDATQNRLAQSAIVEGAGSALRLWRGLQQSLASNQNEADSEQLSDEAQAGAKAAPESPPGSLGDASDEGSSIDESQTEIEQQVGLFFPVGWQDEEDDGGAAGLPWNIRTPFLPRPWTLAFVAALMILLGDTVTQLFCPEIVRRNSLPDYVRNEAEQFGVCPSASVLGNARKLIKAGKKEPCEELLREDEMRSSLMTRATEDSNGSFQFQRDELKQLQIQIVEMASAIRYEAANAKNRVAALLCIVAYLIAAGFLLKILQEQTGNVLRSAGWLG
ncbi:MAG: hypothetical protein ACE361_02645 [Aureliella sp.]